VADAVAGKPDLIITQAGAAHTAAALTKTIPIIVIYSGDLVDGGLVESLARPGGNITGIQLTALDLAGKRVEVLKEIAPSIKRLAVIASPNHPGVHRERDVSIDRERLRQTVTRLQAELTRLTEALGSFARLNSPRLLELM
jgi:putative ABC transport system substrate-binding protein